MLTGRRKSLMSSARFFPLVPLFQESPQVLTYISPPELASSSVSLLLPNYFCVPEFGLAARPL